LLVPPFLIHYPNGATQDVEKLNFLPIVPSLFFLVKKISPDIFRGVPEQ
jgi:hypothetical protein